MELEAGTLRTVHKGTRPLLELDQEKNRTRENVRQAYVLVLLLDKTDLRNCDSFSSFFLSLVSACIALHRVQRGIKLKLRKKNNKLRTLKRRQNRERCLGTTISSVPASSSRTMASHSCD